MRTPLEVRLSSLPLFLPSVRLPLSHSRSPASQNAHHHPTYIEGVRRVLEIATGQSFSRKERLPVDKIDSIRLSTTVATNALLERKGAKHALVVTKGFADLLEIGNQSRPKIFVRFLPAFSFPAARRLNPIPPLQDLNIRRPSVLYSRVLEVDERVTLLGYTSDPNAASRAVQFSTDGKVEKGYDGESHEEGSVVKGLSGEAVQILKRVDEEEVERDLRKLYDEGYRSLAVVLMHSFTFPGTSPLPSSPPTDTDCCSSSRPRTPHLLGRQKDRFHPHLPILRIPSNDPHRRPRRLHHRRRLPHPRSPDVPRFVLQRV